jgi:GAF domain-containing protein
MTIPGRPAPAPDDWPVAVSAALLRALTAHPEQMADLIEALKRRVVDEDSLVELMTRAAREAVRLIQDTHWAGVTAQFAGIPVTAAHTEERVLVVDEGQYGQGDGPCLAAIRLDRPVAMTIEQVRKRWPGLARIADTAGVRSFLAEPLHVRDRAVGSLNLYSARAGGLRTPDPDIVTVLTGYLDRGLTDYSAAQPGEPQAVQLRQHLLDRQLIDTAVGLLMVQHAVSAAVAADLLEHNAARQGCAVRQAAADLITAHNTGHPWPPPAAPDR